MRCQRVPFDSDKVLLDFGNGWYRITGQRKGSLADHLWHLQVHPETGQIEMFPSCHSYPIHGAYAAP